MAYLGNLTCRGCGLTFTSRWGSYARADEYRCDNDHVVHVEPLSGTLLSLDGDIFEGPTLVELRGKCPLCDTELCSGRLPSCPICGERDHEVQVAGTYG